MLGGNKIIVREDRDEQWWEEKDEPTTVSVTNWCYVGNLAYSTSEQDLKDHSKLQTPVESKRDKKGGKGRQPESQLIQQSQQLLNQVYKGSAKKKISVEDYSYDGEHSSLEHSQESLVSSQKKKGQRT